MRTVEDLEGFSQLLDEIDELNKQDEEAIARAKEERERWLEAKKNGKRLQDPD